MTLIELPQEMRSELKEPLGPVLTEINRSRLGESIITVGDIVTYHFLNANLVPDLSIVDGMTKRHEVDEEVMEKWLEIPESIEVENPAGTMTEDLLEGINKGLKKNKPTRIEVEGEEDLAALPAIAIAERGQTVVYGQPDEGMVFVKVNSQSKTNAVSLMRRMEVEDEERMKSLLGVKDIK